MKPNLFNWATSELSQDAFLCWILDWANPSNSDIDACMHTAAAVFLDSLLEKYSLKWNASDVLGIEIFKQKRHIDVWAEIETKHGKYALLIEDKTSSSHHSDQLERYLSYEINIPKDNVLALYFKTVDSSDYQSVLDAGFIVYNRADFLTVMKDHYQCNQILHDFYNRMLHLEQLMQQYKTVPTVLFKSIDPWIGFLRVIKQSIGSGDWSYAPNASGGTMCYYDDLLSDFSQHVDFVAKFGKPYLQIHCTKGRLQIRLDMKCLTNDIDRESLRRIWLDRLNSLSAELQFSKPKRYGSINSKSVSIAEMQLWQDEDIIDVREVELLIRKVKSLFSAWLANYNYS